MNIFVGSGLLVFAALARASLGATLAAEAIENTGVKGGLIVHLGCGDGKLTAALRTSPGFIVQGLDADRKKMAELEKEPVSYTHL
ncbi:MAG: hypothetical protein N3B01_11760, partial [Verrucomicrobiae bacterium]|nr:hypothetical protein [Verrucomicrobiae bacterium]